ncbi:hypothetical protein ACL02R_07290 [Streptomyces sp. MS19]
MSDTEQSPTQRNPDRRPELEDLLREANALSRADRRAKGGDTTRPLPPA